MLPESPDPLFRSLPRETASEYFTPRVMARIRARRVPRQRTRLAVATAALLMIVAGVAAVGGWRRAETTEAARVAAARAEQLRIARELAEIKDLTAGLQPVVYVGSTPEYDVYVDLETLEQAPPVARPASHRTVSRPGV